MIFKTECFANPLWLVWYDYMNMCEWLIDVEYDVYHSMMIFSFTWIVGSCIELLICNDVDIVGECMYVDDVASFCWTCA